jgi:hypothetical protein
VLVGCLALSNSSQAHPADALKLLIAQPPTHALRSSCMPISPFCLLLALLAACRTCHALQTARLPAASTPGTLT